MVEFTDKEWAALYVAVIRTSTDLETEKNEASAQLIDKLQSRLTEEYQKEFQGLTDMYRELVER